MADDPYKGMPLLLHRCPTCERVFGSPSVCIDDGTKTVAYVRPIKLALVKQLGPGEPLGVGMLGLGGVWADAYVVVDFDTGESTVFPEEWSGPHGRGSSGPARTEGLDLRVVVEQISEPTPPRTRRWWEVWK